jgi:hypothetical protein
MTGMEYYIRTQQVLAARAAESDALMSSLGNLQAMGLAPLPSRPQNWRAGRAAQPHVRRRRLFGLGDAPPVDPYGYDPATGLPIYGPMPPDSSPAPAVPAAQSPPGSTLLYSVTYKQNVSTPSPNEAIASLQGGLSTYGMSVVASNLMANTYLGFGSATIQFTIRDTVGHALLSDAQSVLDSLMRQYTHKRVTGSQLSLTSAGSSPAPAAVPPSPSVSPSWLPSWLTPGGGSGSQPSPGWLAQNWPLLALVGGGLLVLKVVEDVL